MDIRITDQDGGGALSGARLTLLDALTLDTLAAGLYADAAGAYATTVQVRLSNVSGASYWVDAPYPNPVSAGHERVTIQYALFGLENVPPTLELYDLLGRPVDPDGYLPAGVYLYRLRLRDGGLTKAQSVVLARGGGVTFALTPMQLTPAFDAYARVHGVGEIVAEVIALAEKDGYAAREERLRLAWGRPHTARITLVNQNRLAAYRAEVVSPDGRVVVDLNLHDADGQRDCLFYRITYDGKPVVLDSQLGLELHQQQPLRCGFQIARLLPQRHDETWQPLYGERSAIPDVYNGLLLELKQLAVHERTLRLEVRAYDEGAAFRYGLDDDARLGPFIITAERTELRFPAGTNGYAHYWMEAPYERTPIEAITKGCEHPLTVEYADGRVATFTEAAVVDYARMWLTPSRERAGTLESALASHVRIDETPFWTPWRVFLLGDDPGDLIEHNYLLLNLNPPSTLQNTAWIRPGKAMRVMANTTEAAQEVVDFAAQHNIAYLSLSAGWYGDEYDEHADATTPVPALDVQAVVAYAIAHDVGVFLYVNRLALERQLDELLPLYRSWGVKGIKFGFVRNREQAWSRWMHGAVKKAAAHELLLDIHDAYRPTGVSRSYPNLLTQEGLRGNEHQPSAKHNVTLPFTRFVAGAADYTISYYDTRLQTSYAHQLAMAVVYYSPLQFLFWYDTPGLIRGEAALGFWDAVPTVWDETRVVQGRIGAYITVARRSGEEWYVGSLTDEAPRTLALALDFLEPGRSYVAHLFEDDVEAGRGRAPVRLEHRLVDATTTLTVSMASRGGQAIRLVPISEDAPGRAPAHQER